MSGFRAGFVSAAPITPTTVKATSYWFVVDGNRNNLINGSGLSGGGSVLTQTHRRRQQRQHHVARQAPRRRSGRPCGNPAPRSRAQILEFDLWAPTYALDQDPRLEITISPVFTGARGEGHVVGVWTSPDATSVIHQAGRLRVGIRRGRLSWLGGSGLDPRQASDVRRVQFRRVSTVWSGASARLCGIERSAV